MAKHHSITHGSTFKTKVRVTVGKMQQCNSTQALQSARVRAGPQFPFPQFLAPPDVTDARCVSPPNGPQTQDGKGLLVL